MWLMQTEKLLDSTEEVCTKRAWVELLLPIFIDVVSYLSKHLSTETSAAICVIFAAFGSHSHQIGYCKADTIMHWNFIHTVHSLYFPA